MCIICGKGTVHSHYCDEHTNPDKQREFSLKERNTYLQNRVIVLERQLQGKSKALKELKKANN